MQSLKKFYFGKQKAKVNTYIGGIGGTINTPALLASKLGISESRIKLFKVTGVDVECAIVRGSYEIREDAFSHNTQITYFIDYIGLVTRIKLRAFKITTSNFKKGVFPKCTNIENAAFYCENYSEPNIDLLYLPRCTSVGDSPSVNNGVFGNQQRSYVKLYINDFIRTCNSGLPDPDITTYSPVANNVRYVTNFTPPNPVTNLSVGTIYNTVVQLNFTPPTSVNGIDFYEVYINGERFNSKKIKNSGEFITGLTPSTNYNIRIVAVDMFYNISELSNTVNVSTNTVDADSYFYINASGNQAYETAIVALFTDLKSQGLYNKIQAFYPFLGTTQAQHKWNAKNPLDTNKAFRLQFFGGGTHSNLGYQCNGTNAYANTFLSPSAVQNVNSNGLTITVGTNNSTTKSDVVEIGSFISVTQASIIASKSNNTTFRRGSRMNGESIFQDNQNDAKGIFTNVKQSSTVTKLLRNKVEIASGNSGGTLPTVSFFIGNMNLRGSPYTDGWSNQRIQFTAIHEGLTDAEVMALHTIIDNFESAIGRKTW